jgi:hypothetical protein
VTTAPAPTWREMVTTFRRTSCRLETLSRYTVDPHEEGFRQYLEGRPVPPADPDLEDWRRLVAEATGAGRTVARVRAISGPMPAYARYELDWGYPGNAAVGERIHILHVADLGAVLGPEPVGDFYLFDDQAVLTMEYDAEGRPLPSRLLTTPSAVAEYRRLWDLARRSAMSLEAYLAAQRREPVLPPTSETRAA